MANDHSSAGVPHLLSATAIGDRGAPSLEGRDPVATGAILPTIECGKFTAHLDAFAWTRGRVHRQLDFWFLSLVGSQVALRAIWARLLKGEIATVLPDGPLGRASFATLGPEGAGGWRARTASLPGAGGHQLALFPESAFFLTGKDDFTLIPPPRGHARDVPLPHLHYRYLNRRTDLPLHPEWAGWLWARALRLGEATKLETYGLADRAHRCAPNPARLRADLSAAVAAGELTVGRERADRTIAA